jgi:hypothetical protein
MSIHFKNEQEGKTSPVRGGTSGKEEGNGGEKKGEYGQCTLYVCMKIEQ